MALLCKSDSKLGGKDNPIDKCGEVPGRQGECRLMAFPDRAYCSGHRYEYWYDPTEEEAAGYDSHKWINEIGDKLFGAIFGLFNNAISTATGGIIDDWLGSGHTLESLLDQVVSNGTEKLASLTDEIGTKINQLIAGNINRSAEAMGEFVGIANAQKRIADSVVNSVEYLLEKGEWEAETRMREEQAAAEEAADRMAADIAWAEAIQDGLFSELTESTLGRLQQDGLTLFDRADELLGFTFNHIELNRKIMYTMAMAHGQTVAASFAAVAEADLDSANEILLESVIKPLAMGEAYYTAIKTASIATIEEVRGSLIDSAIAHAELVAEMLGTEMNPLDWLRSHRVVD